MKLARRTLGISTLAIILIVLLILALGGGGYAGGGYYYGPGGLLRVILAILLVMGKQKATQGQTRTSIKEPHRDGARSRRRRSFQVATDAQDRRAR